MGVAENFSAFRANYIVPAATVSTISYRYKRITRQLNSDFWNTTSETSHSLYVGSYGRDSAAKGVSDVDMSFTLPVELYNRYNAYQGNGQSALLQSVKNSIARTYPNTYVGGDGQVVWVSFGDSVHFEILPVFLNQDGKSFTFADSNAGGSWRVCNPRAEMDAFGLRNSAVNGNLKSLCRMARIWRDYHTVPLSGMLLDTLAFQFINSWQYRDKSHLYHDYMIRDFLAYLAAVDTSQQFWRAPGSGSSVAKTGNFQRPAANGHALAVSAIGHEANQRPQTARNKWRELFGPTYP